MGNENNRSQQYIDTKPKTCCDKFSLYISGGHVDSSEITCSICFTIFSNPRIMKCKHIICQNCIQEWGKCNLATCPFCRMQLKKNRGNFGRVDKKTQKKIDKMFLKCRNCYWTGSYCQFTTTFQSQPYLDEDTLPGETIQAHSDLKEQEGEIIEQKKENPEIEIKAQKEELKEEQKDDVVQLKSLGQSGSYELFVDSFFQLRQLRQEELILKEFLDQDYYESRNQDFDDI